MTAASTHRPHSTSSTLRRKRPGIHFVPSFLEEQETDPNKCGEILRPKRTTPIDEETPDRFVTPPPRDPPDDEPLPLWAMKITQSAYGETMDYLRGRKPEAAGILIRPALDDVLVTHFIPDVDGRATPVSFELNAANLNRVLKERKPAGLTCKGIVHSHPAGISQPSCGDVVYFNRLFARPANADTQQIFVPIVCTGRLFPYVFAHGRVFSADLILV